MKTTQHFLSLNDLSLDSLEHLIARAIEIKSNLKKGVFDQPLKGKTLAMLFTKASTRTRVSFETGMFQMGGTSINLSASDTQIGRGEPIKDSARVISSMVDGILIRTDAHSKVEEFAEYSSVPVINGLTDDFHPCQLLADLQTFYELRGSIKGARVAWVGDGNNMCHSWMNAARLFDFKLAIATPAGYAPQECMVEQNRAVIEMSNDPVQAAKHANVVVTDTWASMGQENEKTDRAAAFEGFCVDNKLMEYADDEALFMHCLPAYRGLEVSDSVMEGKHSVIFQEAENRLHAQKALLEFLLVS